MLSGINRLKKRQDVLFVLEKGTQTRGRFFRLKASRTTRIAPPRIAVIVSAKEAKKAVTRNSIKRRTREVVKKCMPALFGYDLLIFPSKNIQDADFFDLVKELTYHANTLKNRNKSY
ncbi:MAG: ribonuclease P protein component [bacterium]|nr:ribonuclease P protein component [bacterium]